MKATFVIFERMTALDFVGVYGPLTRLRSMGLRLLGQKRKKVQAGRD